MCSPIPEPTKDGQKLVERKAVLADYKRRLALESLRFFRVPYDMMGPETIVELAIYHMLGIIKKYTTQEFEADLRLDEDLNVVLTLNVNGLIKDGIVNKKMKLGDMSKFIKLIQFDGWYTMLRLFDQMKVPNPAFEHKDFMSVRIEVNYVWLKYIKITRQNFKEACLTIDDEE